MGGEQENVLVEVLGGGGGRRREGRGGGMEEREEGERGRREWRRGRWRGREAVTAQRLPGEITHYSTCTPVSEKAPFLGLGTYHLHNWVLVMVEYLVWLLEQTASGAELLGQLV